MSAALRCAGLATRLWVRGDPEQGIAHGDIGRHLVRAPVDHRHLATAVGHVDGVGRRVHRDPLWDPAHPDGGGDPDATLHRGAVPRPAEARDVAAMVVAAGASPARAMPTTIVPRWIILMMT